METTRGKGVKTGREKARHTHTHVGVQTHNEKRKAYQLSRSAIKIIFQGWECNASLEAMLASKDL